MEITRLLGALIAGSLFRPIGLSAVSNVGSVIVATVGAVTLLVAAKALGKA